MTRKLRTRLTPHRRLDGSPLWAAVSGGVDSLTMAQWMSDRGVEFRVAHYVHDSDFAVEELKFVTEVCHSRGWELIVAHQTPGPRTGGLEAYWRQGRYQFFNSLPGTVATAHTLDDAVEWYLFSALRGEPHFMSHSNGNVVRPFITTRKSRVVDYARERGVKWLEDPSNLDPHFATRNYIRTNLIEPAQVVNPGLFNMVARNIQRKTREKTSHAT